MQLKNRTQANQAALAPFAKFTGLATSSTARPSAAQGNAQQFQIVSRRVAAGVTVQSSVLNGFPSEAPVRVSKPISKMPGTKASGKTAGRASATPFTDALAAFTPPTPTQVMTTPAASLTDRQKITATHADAQAASKQVDALRAKLSDVIWTATLAGKRANPAELDRLRGQIERAEATHKQLGKEATETEQRILARKSSAVRAVLSFSEWE